MTHASLKYAQLLTQGEIFQGDLFMPTKYQRDGPKNDQDWFNIQAQSVSASLMKINPTRQMDFGEAQVMFHQLQQPNKAERSIDKCRGLAGGLAHAVLVVRKSNNGRKADRGRSQSPNPGSRGDKRRDSRRELPA